MNKKNKYYQYVLALGHGCSDINQSILSAILPFLIASQNFDYATASILVMLSNIVGSMVQPIIGNFADKRNAPWIITLGVFLAGFGMAITGFLNNFIGLAIAVMISGIGVAMFHPQSARLVALTSPKKKEGKGISIFAFGGKLGFTLGPILCAFCINTLGMKGTIIFLIPTIIFGLVSVLFMKDFYEIGEERIDKKKAHYEREDQWNAFAKLCIVVFSRSIITNAMSTFLVLYLVDKLSLSTTTANTLLSVYYGIAAICTLLGGNIADQYGHIRVIRSSFFIFLIAIAGFIYLKNIVVMICLLMIMACAESLSYSPMIVLGQQYLPNHTGLASGITLGLAVSIGAIVVPFMGKLSDMYSISISMPLIALFVGIAFISSMFLTKLQH